MKHNVVYALIACAVGACSAVSGNEVQPETMVEVEVQASTAEIVVPPPPEVIAAALSGDPDAMARVMITSGCHAPFECPPQYGSPTIWSSFTWCDEVCDAGSCPPGEGFHGHDTFESYRLKFDSAQNACTEWQVETLPICGC